MAGRIVKDDIEALRKQADIVAVVGDYTTIKRAGRNFKGLCPFHTEKTPSFSVTPEGNFFHCFGCGASGDIYDFLMRIEGLQFNEAVEALARRTGFTLHYEELSARQRQALGQRSRLVDVTGAALDFFRKRLYSDEGTPARDYLKSRGFGREDADTFDLGFAPNQWDALVTVLRSEGLDADELISAGVALRTQRGGLIDRFRGRLVFPIHDPGGDVIGFGGRILPGLDYGDDTPPKYLNSPETPLYKKARVLYGVPQARAEIVREGTVLVCEGYTDVLALHQAGVANAVATCGTAVGPEHLELIARYAPRVVLAFDADSAGVQAAERAWAAARDLQAREGGIALEVRVLVLPEGRDPADLVQQEGADTVRAAVEGATPIVPFVLRAHLATADLESEAGRTAALRDALGILSREADPDLRREWARTEVAAGIGVAYDFVASTAARLGVDLDRHEGVAVQQPTRQTDASRRPDVARARRERDVLRVALQQPDLLPDEWYELTEADFRHPTAQAIFRALTDAGGAGVALDAVLTAAADDDLRATIRGVALEDEPVGLDREVAAWRVRGLVAEGLEAEARDLRDRLATLHHARDRDELLEVQRRLYDLEQRRRALTAVAE